MRAWNEKLNKVLGSLGFVKCSKEPAVYRKTEKDDALLVAVYVDDLLVTGTSLELITEFKKRMAENFEMSDLGKLTYYFGIEVVQHQGGITLKQERYAMRILSQTWLKDCNAVHIPMDLVLKLSKAQEEESVMKRNIGGT